MLNSVKRCRPRRSLEIAKMSRKRQVPFPDQLSSLAAAEDRHFVTALARGLEVLACFRKGEALLGNQEIAERCRLPKSTVSRLTYTLTKLGYLHYADSAGKYRLGTAILALGTSMLSRLDVRNIARPLMEEIAKAYKISVALGARDRLSMVYVEAFLGYTPISLNLDVGSRISISTSALGRAFLAVCTPEMRDSILKEIQAISSTNWPRTLDGISKAIEDHQTLGCTCSFGDWQPNVNAIAVGFNPGGGLPPMALNSGAPDVVASREFLLEKVRPELITLARKLEGCMGF
jgi:DNA-binding IclR family transcriptional regulator